jgi:hypothetical protein
MKASAILTTLPVVALATPHIHTSVYQQQVLSDTAAANEIDGRSTSEMCRNEDGDILAALHTRHSTHSREEPLNVECPYDDDDIQDYDSDSDDESGDSSYPNFPVPLPAAFPFPQYDLPQVFTDSPRAKRGYTRPETAIMNDPADAVLPGKPVAPKLDAAVAGSAGSGSEPRAILHTTITIDNKDELSSLMGDWTTKFDLPDTVTVTVVPQTDVDTTFIHWKAHTTLVESTTTVGEVVFYPPGGEPVTVIHDDGSGKKVIKSGNQEKESAASPYLSTKSKNVVATGMALVSLVVLVLIL